jgi:uncharacterized membrane protein
VRVLVPLVLRLWTLLSVILSLLARFTVLSLCLLDFIVLLARCLLFFGFHACFLKKGVLRVRPAWLLLAFSEQFESVYVGHVLVACFD